jgi:capsule polysaccharide export protein KpsE/RkpR
MMRREDMTTERKTAFLSEMGREIGEIDTRLDELRTYAQERHPDIAPRVDQLEAARRELDLVNQSVHNASALSWTVMGVMLQERVEVLKSEVMREERVLR